MFSQPYASAALIPSVSMLSEKHSYSDSSNKVKTMIDDNPQEKPKRQWSNEFVEATVAFLVSCLYCGTRAIEDSCKKVLADFGPLIVPQLQRIVRRDEL